MFEHISPINSHIHIIKYDNFVLHAWDILIDKRKIEKREKERNKERVEKSV